MNKTFLDTIAENLSLTLTIILIVIFLLYTILDIFGITHKYRDKIPNFILLIICISLTESILDRKREVGKLNERIENLQITANENHNLIVGLEKKNLTEKLVQTHNLTDPILENMFKEHIDNEINFFDNLLNNDYIVISNVQQYYDYYIKSLDVISKLHNSKITVKAASILSKNYLWKTTGELTPLELAFKKFIDKGNKMERLFYVDSSISDTTINNILKRQKSIGVTVYTLNYDEYKNTVFNLESPPLFAVFDCGDKKCKNNLAWEVTVDKLGNANRFKYMKSLDRCQNLIDIYDALNKSASCKKY